MFVTCRSCAKRFSDRAPACPFCGTSPPKARLDAPGSVGSVPTAIGRPPDRTDRVRPDPSFHLSAGSVLARTFRLWATNFLALSVLGALIHSPAIAAWTLIAVIGGHDPERRNIFSSVANLLGLILNLILEGAVTYSVFGQIRGWPVPVGVALRIGLSRANAVLGAILLVGLVMLPACVCLIVPGLILATWYWVAVPVAVIESPGSRAALTRSKELTQGDRWPVFACMSYLGMMRLAGFAVIVAGVRAAGGPAVFERVTGSRAASMQLTPGAKGVVELLTIPLLTLGVIGATVAYHDLRFGKEGTTA